jgi:hypothetical protein
VNILGEREDKFWLLQVGRVAVSQATDENFPDEIEPAEMKFPTLISCRMGMA